MFSVLSGCGGNQFFSRELPPPETKVAVVIFTDFNCPACKFASGLTKKIKNISGLYFELRHLPLPISGHETSEAAANAFECGKVQGFGDKMEDALFKNQGTFSEELFLKIPKTHNFGKEFNSEKFEKCVIGNEFKGLTRKDLSVAKNLKINATPTFFVNGAKTTSKELLEKISAEFKKLK